MINLKTKLSLFLTLYIASLIIFMQNYINITYAIDIVLVGMFSIHLYKNKGKFNLNPIIIAYLLFTILALSSSLWAISFEDTSYKSLQMLLLLINLIVIFNIINDFDLKYSFINGILLGSLFNYLIMLGVISVPFEVYMGDRYMGTTGNPNSLAIVLLTSMFLSMYYLLEEQVEKNWLYYYQYVNILFALYAILLTVSKKGVLFGSVLFLLYIVILLKTKKGIGKIITLGMLTYIAFKFFVDIEQLNTYIDSVTTRFDAFSSALDGNSDSGNSTAIRQRLIELGLNVFQSEPLFGYGLANYRFLSGGQYAHNNFIEVLVGLGLIGFTVFYSMRIYLFYLIYKMQKSDLKLLLIIYVSILLFMDLAVVSYGSKLSIYLLVFLYVIISKKLKIKD